MTRPLVTLLHISGSGYGTSASFIETSLLQHTLEQGGF